MLWSYLPYESVLLCLSYRSFLLIICCGIVIYLLCYKFEYIQRYVQDSRISFDKKSPHIFPSTCTSELRHVWYVRTPKCGSTTCLNIFYRFCKRRNLTVLLPTRGYRITLKNVISLPPNRSHFDVATNHVVNFSVKSFSKLLPVDTVYITQIRYPMTRAISDYIHNIIKNPLGTYFTVDRFLMAEYMGLAPGNANNMSAVEEFVHQANEEYYLVMIMEYMAESIVLLKRKLCWSLSDVIYVKLNKQKRPGPNVTEDDKRLHRQLAAADYYLYDQFVKKLWREIEQQGEEFYEEVRHFETILRHVELFCSTWPVKRGDLVIPQSKWNEVISVSNEDCKFITMDPLPFQRYMRDLQM